MNVVELLGYLASLFVLAAFCMRGMVSLRVLALASNVAFIAYATLAAIHPVLLLHLVLLPMNAWRLAEVLRLRRQLMCTPASAVNTALAPAVARRRRARLAPPPSHALRRRRASTTHYPS